MVAPQIITPTDVCREQGERVSTREECVMKKNALLRLSVTLSVALHLTATAWAVPTQVSIDVSGISGSDFELDISLYDNSGVIGDTWVRIDDVFFGAQSDDFELGDIGSFDDSLNPASVYAAPGSVIGPGDWVMRIDEDLIVTPTITFRDYTGTGHPTLTFEFDMTTTGTVGPFGLDELVFSLLDPVTLAPLVPGLTGFGDVLAVTNDGMEYTADVTVAVIPLPPAVLLCMIGVVGTRVVIRRSRNSA
jgi:hypothetical protein